MKIKNVIFENNQYFETIKKIHKSDQLSVMDAYRINRLVKKLDELNEEHNELKKKIFLQYGMPGKKEGTTEIEQDHREVFEKEYNDLINMEHDLETEMLEFPNKIKDGISAADFTIMEMFFDLSGLEEKEKTEDVPETLTEEEAVIPV